MTVFKDKSILKITKLFHETHVFDKLVGRQEALQELEQQLFREGLEPQDKKLPDIFHAFLSGLHASGKTYSIAYFFQKRLPELGKRGIDALYVDCRKLSPVKVIKTIIRENFEPGFNCLTFDDALNTLVGYLDRDPHAWIIFLDNMQVVETTTNIKRLDRKFILPLVDMEANVVMPRIKVAWVFITTGENLKAKLTKETKSRVHKCKPVILGDYTKEEMKEILELYAEHAFHTNAIDKAAIDYIANDVAAVGADIRLAILNLRASGVLADIQGASKVTIEHAKEVTEEDQLELWEEQIMKLADDTQIILYSLAQIQDDYLPDLDMVPYTAAYTEYRAVAKTLGHSAQSTSSYSNKIDDLQNVRLVVKTAQSGGSSKYSARNWSGLRVCVPPSAVTKILTKKFGITKNSATKQYEAIA